MSLKIVGGSFGVNGYVSLNKETGVLSINRGAATYLPEQIKSIDSDAREEKKYSVFSIVLGILLVTPVLTFLFSLWGLIAGVLFTVFGASYTVDKSSSEIEFTDGKKVRVQGRRKHINQLSNYK